ncbi:alpha/beta-hydrolase [Dothidotthia symphoricarpi CBS 119687]|uniref:Alpha/beta-hydrolase n=1 Tax=Dothidotthia symphoricarpi CBS 119687 TaxID=1392245 RepID=A0A6A6ATX4_9PLEO|nr:alpha/beta-hydrolase [Dothidotthia symphoricarpi CBS 119687]KAF2134638.1 alpha/beta-hydrolase [Dothidotthia symphoricarpi CBS 119687]
MADNDIATRAPESDAQEQPVEQAGQSVFPGDTTAQEGPTMGEHCTTDRPSPPGQKPTGEFSKLGDIECYIAKPSDYPHSPSKLLLLLTGGTGIKSTNNQLQADKYASEGYVVVMPDQFNGNQAPNSVMPETSEQASWLEQAKMKGAEVLKALLIDKWLAYHTPERVLPVLHKVIEGAKEEFADAVANGEGIYGVGYCFGAKYILILAGEHPDTASGGQAPPKDEEQGTVSNAPVLRAAAVAHGTMVMKEDLEAVKVPTYIVAVENDSLFSEEEVLTPGRRAMETNKVEHEVKVFSGVPHGFAVLGDYEDAKIKQSQEEAYGLMLAWIQAH